MFHDADGTVLDITQILAKMKILSTTESRLPKDDGTYTMIGDVPILTELKKLADASKLTREKLLSVEYTDLLRLATYPKAAEFIQKEFRVRGLPMKPGFTLMPHQIKTIEWMRQREAMNPTDTYGIRGGVVSLRMGLGKCHGRDTPILMWDGTIKKVQDIKTGELICGDDSTPRKVLSRARGFEMMYRITPTKGDSYVVNASHILSLKISGNRSVYWDNSAQRYIMSWFDHSRYTVNTNVSRITRMLLRLLKMSTPAILSISPLPTFWLAPRILEIDLKATVLASNGQKNLFLLNHIFLEHG